MACFIDKSVSSQVGKGVNPLLEKLDQGDWLLIGFSALCNLSYSNKDNS